MFRLFIYADLIKRKKYVQKGIKKKFKFAAGSIGVGFFLSLF
jgi:hypothetical protein